MKMLAMLSGSMYATGVLKWSPTEPLWSLLIVAALLMGIASVQDEFRL